MTEVLTGLVPWPVASVAIQSLTAKDHSIFAGLTFGLTLGITCHGLLGYAAKNAKTALDAILLDEQYLAMRTNAIRFRVRCLLSVQFASWAMILRWHAVAAGFHKPLWPSEWRHLCLLFGEWKMVMSEYPSISSLCAACIWGNTSFGRVARYGTR